MREIKHIVIHCTGTTADVPVKNIQAYWKNKLGWKHPGYHFIITANGTVKKLLPIKHIANGAKGFNHNSIHIGYVGGVNKDGKATDTRTKAQEEAMFNLIIELYEKFREAEILGHRDLPNVRKSCPSFDVKHWLAYYEPDFDNINDIEFEED